MPTSTTVTTWTSTRRAATSGISSAALLRSPAGPPSGPVGHVTSVVSSPAIVLESASRRYGSTTVVHDLSFTVERGEIVGFLGPNGAGKTTTMRMIAGFTAATSGRVLVGGHDMAVDHVTA